MSRIRGTAVLAVVVAMLAALSPTASDALPGQQPPPGGLPQSDPSGPTIGINVDVVNGNPGDVKATFDDLLSNVDGHLEQLEEAEAQLDEANADLERARSDVAETETLITELTALRDDLVTEAFMSPPSVDSIDSLLEESVSDLAVKQALLDIRADSDASVLEQLEEAETELEEQRDEERALEATARDARDNASAKLNDLESAVNQQTMFAVSVEERLERGSSEAMALAEVDPELAAELEAEQDELADLFQEILDAQEWAEAVEALAKAIEEAERQREAEEAARRQREAEQAAAAAAAAEAETSSTPEDLGPASGDLATVSCPGGGSITVDNSLAGNLSSLLSAAANEGITLCGGGYRDPAEQIALREAHCGTSHYAIYEMPSSQCSPPTARPGTSNHEKGLAIDFRCNGGGAISSQSSPCFVWLSNNAASYGLYNLPSEPWHWSTDGN